MDARVTKAELDFLLPRTPSRVAAEVEAIRLAAMQARDEAARAWLRRGLTRTWQFVATLAEAVVTYPARRSAYEELRQLSDRELADIGLTRGDIGRVFEPSFRAPRGGTAAGARRAAAVPTAAAGAAAAHAA
jgi:uncharacterized protein YjiS (DUF1127 family)